jgi:hypothetical protein
MQTQTRHPVGRRVGARAAANCSKGFRFDNIDHTLLLRAVRKHVKCEWALLYVLANLFLHYTFDARGGVPRIHISTIEFILSTLVFLLYLPPSGSLASESRLAPRNGEAPGRSWVPRPPFGLSSAPTEAWHRIHPVDAGFLAVFAANAR